MSPFAVMAMPNPSTTNDISGNRRAAHVLGPVADLKQLVVVVRELREHRAHRQEEPAADPETAAPTWNILKTEYHWVLAAKRIETATSAMAIDR